MTKLILLAGCLVYLVAVCALLSALSRRLFWGQKFLRLGYQILRSRRHNALVLDTGVVFLLGLLAMGRWVAGLSVLRHSFVRPSSMLFLCVMAFLLARFLERYLVLYDEQGLLLIKPFRRPCFVPWEEIGVIQTRRGVAWRWNIYDWNGEKLTWFPREEETEPFLEMAACYGVAVRMPRDGEMLGENPENPRETPMEWDAVLARSPYGRSTVLSTATFDGFLVALLMDRRLDSNNIVAINRDGSVRWTIGEIVRGGKFLSFGAMTAAGPGRIRVMAAMDPACPRKVWEIDVFQENVVREYEEEPV